MRRIEIHDSSLRDSIGDFVTLQLKSGELVEALGLLDRAGFASIDAFGGNIFLPTMSVLGEDPWARLRAVRKAVKHTPLQAVVRGRMLFGRWIAPDATIIATLKHLRDIGVDRIKIADPGLDLAGSARVVSYAKYAGFHVTAAVSLSWGETKRLDEILMRAVNAHHASGADAIGLQDPYGLLTPASVADAVRRHKLRSTLPLRLHLHDVNLLAVSSLEAGLKSGALGADTTISTLAWSYSPPQTESLIMALRGSEISTALDMSALENAADWFNKVKMAKGFKYKAVYGVDHELMRGSMPSAIKRAMADTLRDKGRMDLLDRCWKEVGRVWETLGQPPLFSPMVQAVCAQAYENVSGDLPYGKLDYRISAYLRGEFGKVMPDARADLVARASQIPTARPTMPLNIDDLAPENFTTEDDRVTHANFPMLADEFFRKRAKNRHDAPDSRFVGLASQEAQSTMMPRSLVINRHGETFEVALEGMGPLEDGKRMLFLRIGGETARIEVTFPPEGGAPSYRLMHHGKSHTFDFLEILHAGKHHLPVVIKEDGKEEEILYSFPRE